jgi:hypothetical protein
MPEAGRSPPSIGRGESSGLTREGSGVPVRSALARNTCYGPTNARVQTGRGPRNAGSGGFPANGERLTRRSRSKITAKLLLLVSSPLVLLTWFTCQKPDFPLLPLHPQSQETSNEMQQMRWVRLVEARLNDCGPRSKSALLGCHSASKKKCERCRFENHRMNMQLPSINRSSLAASLCHFALILHCFRTISIILRTSSGLTAKPRHCHWPTSKLT